MFAEFIPSEWGACSVRARIPIWPSPLCGMLTHTGPRNEACARACATDFYLPAYPPAPTGDRNHSGRGHAGATPSLPPDTASLDGLRRGCQDSHRLVLSVDDWKGAMLPR